MDLEKLFEMAIFRDEHASFDRRMDILPVITGTKQADLGSLRVYFAPNQGLKTEATSFFRVSKLKKSVAVRSLAIRKRQSRKTCLTGSYRVSTNSNVPSLRLSKG